MKKILIVGGQESFIKSKWASHLEGFGCKVGWCWDYKRRKLPVFPPSAEAVILITDMCSHIHRNKAIKSAKRWGIPFAEVGRQWLKAVPILEQKGIIKQPAIEEVIMITNEHPLTQSLTPVMADGFKPSHPDFEDWLDILLEDDELSVASCVEQMEALIEPKPLTDEMKNIIRNKVNRKLIENSTPLPPPEKEKTVTSYFLSSMKQAEAIAKALVTNEAELLASFITKCATKKKPNVPTGVRAICKLHEVNNPTLFSGVIYHTFVLNDYTTTPEIINKAYERIFGRKHNYTKPREVFAHYKCEWTEHTVTKPVIERTEKGIARENWEKEATTETIQAEVIQTLSANMDDLVGMIKQQAEQIKHLESLVLQNKQTTTNDGDTVSFTVNKNDLIQFLLQNNKLNLTINQQ